jgi:diaminohydroxyphosphoribosylaminopyrimidine deaminase/5-amino-6-(5-phosphoribosylamino)uracil reductase
MNFAYLMAVKAWGETHPNPMVGAVIIEGEKVVGQGFHAQAGAPHAEVMALRNLGRAPAPGATLYVTLEPCCTTGRTPPCTEAIINSGIKHVVVGALDPNPQHAGKGLDILRAAGIAVTVEDFFGKCADLNFIFNHWITTGRPLFAGKIATTIDGRVATRTGESKWITGEEARQNVMRWRRLFPAIGVGAGTVLADDPQLTSRYVDRDKKIEWCPVRLIFDRQLRTVTDSLPKVYTDAHAARTIVVTGPSPDEEKRAILEKHWVGIWTMPAENNAAWFAALREKCAAAGLIGVFLEGGPTLLNAFLAARELDYLFAYRGSKFLADAEALPVFSGPARPALADAYQLANVQCATLGTDQLMRGHIVYPTIRS